MRAPVDRPDPLATQTGVVTGGVSPPRTLVVGDVHGCAAELFSLLDHAGLAAGDGIVLAGDLFDRGPDSAAVWTWARQRQTVHAVMGNHERRHVAARERPDRVALSAAQRVTRRALGPDYAQAVDWMQQLPAWWLTHGAIVVHAALEPALPLPAQRLDVLTGEPSGERHLRHTLPHAWYRCWTGEPVIVGHKDYRRDGQPFVYQDRIVGLDTGCVRGGRLTGLVLPDWRFVSVPSRQ